jgi:hypothetical protein
MSTYRTVLVTSTASKYGNEVDLKRFKTIVYSGSSILKCMVYACQAFWDYRKQENNCQTVIIMEVK